MKEGWKMCVFNEKNWPYLRNGERYGQGYYNHLQEVAYALIDEMKIVDLG